MGMEMTVEELAARRKAGDEPLLLDVREPHELRICSIGGKHIPMNEVPARLAELDPARELVVYCRSGARSGQVVAFLRQRGFAKAVNLAGGILAWADRVDPRVAKY